MATARIVNRVAASPQLHPVDSCLTRQAKPSETLPAPAVTCLNHYIPLAHVAQPWRRTSQLSGFTLPVGRDWLVLGSIPMDRCKSDTVATHLSSLFLQKKKHVLPRLSQKSVSFEQNLGQSRQTRSFWRVHDCHSWTQSTR
jgi:hypothetical protein